MTEKELKYHKTYLKMALEWANLSHCARKKVGCLIVKNGTIISDGFNGSPSGIDNKCEDCDGNTQWYIIHAEMNAILKMAKSTQSSEDATMYLTHSPCRECTKAIIQSKIKEVFYIEDYKDITGIEFLKQNSISVFKINL